MLRILLGLVIGVLVAFTVVAVGEAVGHWIYPPLPGTDLSDPEALKTLMATLPTQAIAAVLVAWAAASFLGGAVAGAIARRHWAALVIGGVMLAIGAATMAMIPHPLWFMIASMPVTLLPAWAASKVIPGQGLGIPEKK